MTHSSILVWTQNRNSKNNKNIRTHFEFTLELITLESSYRPDILGGAAKAMPHRSFGFSPSSDFCSTTRNNTTFN